MLQQTYGLTSLNDKNTFCTKDGINSIRGCVISKSGSSKTLSIIKRVFNETSLNSFSYFFLGSMNFYRYSRHPWAAMTHLTPSELDVFLKPNLGIRNMSDAIARKVIPVTILYER
jgi:hypothetical protein